MALAVWIVANSLSTSSKSKAGRDSQSSSSFKLLCSAFAGSGVDVFLLSMKAGGTGLNLTAANRVVLMDLSWNPQDNRQAEDRAHRLGQLQPVTVTYLTTSDTIEEKVVSCNVAKMELDYKFGGQKTVFGTAFDASSDEEEPKQELS